MPPPEDSPAMVVKLVYFAWVRERVGEIARTG